MYVELHVPNFDIAREFYQKFGFEVAWQKMPENEPRKWYMVMRNGDAVLGFWPGNDQVYTQTYFKNFPNDTKRGYAVEIVITVENVEELYSKVKDQVKIVGELQARHWGLKDFRIEDPFGFYLRFTEPHDILKADNS